MPSVTLKLEDGYMLKPHMLTWHIGGYSPPPPGWTPDDIFNILMLMANLMLNSDGTLDALEKVQVEAWAIIERQHHDANEDWAGWAPISYQKDSGIKRAYHELFVELNGHECPMKYDKHATYPPDGEYDYRNGKMRLTPDADAETS